MRHRDCFGGLSFSIYSTSVCGCVVAMVRKTRRHEPARTGSSANKQDDISGKRVALNSSSSSVWFALLVDVKYRKYYVNIFLCLTIVRFVVFEQGLVERVCFIHWFAKIGS